MLKLLLQLAENLLFAHPLSFQNLPLNMLIYAMRAKNAFLALLHRIREKRAVVQFSLCSLAHCSSATDLQPRCRIAASGV